MNSAGIIFIEAAPIDAEALLAALKNMHKVITADSSAVMAIVAEQAEPMTIDYLKADAEQNYVLPKKREQHPRHFMSGSDKKRLFKKHSR